MADRINVFISSTSRDLTKYRDKVKEVVLAHGMFPIGMEEFQPTKDNALQKCYDEVQNAEIFIGIYAHRYGYAPSGQHTYESVSGDVRHGDGKTSITHLEYLWAIERNLPIFLFVLADEDDEGELVRWPPTYIEDEPGKSRLKAFKSHIMDRHVVKFFHSPDDLAAKAATALASVSRETTGKAPRRRADFFKHIPLPPNYIIRSELLGELRLTLLGDDDVALTSAIKPAQALHGMGGIGKSVMARALCEEPLVQTAFPDGILWTTLGSEVTEADIRQKLRDWILALGGGIEENAPSLVLLQSKLATLLEDRACLLILDDVWKKKDAEAFRIAGHRCRLLITTRDAEVARSLGANIQPVPVMTVDEAVALLEEWAAGLVDTPRALKDRIVARLGRLPLAIKLAGGQLTRRDPQTWLERFDARKLEDRRGAPDDPHSSLARCFTLSLEDLREMDRKLYAALTIFREDEPILEAAISRLWEGLEDLDADGTQDLIDDLAARALMEVAGEHYPRAVVLHDLLRDFMRSELADGEATAHQALLTAYETTYAGDKWYTASDDGYLYDHLGYHLKRAGRTDEFHTLVTASRNWMDARFRQSYGDHAFVKDIELLLEDYKGLTGSERIIPHAQLVTARQVVGARVAVYTDDRLEALVWVRREREAMNHALLRSEPKKRFDGLLRVLQTLAERDEIEITELATYSELSRIIDDLASPSEKGIAQGSLVSELVEIDRIDDALTLAAVIETPDDKARALSVIAEKLANTGQTEHALEIAKTIQDTFLKASALTAVATGLAESGQNERSLLLLDEALELARTIDEPYLKVSSLCDIASQLSKFGLTERSRALFDEALEATQSLDDEEWKGFALQTVAVALAEADRLTKALSIARSINDHPTRARTLSTIAEWVANTGHIEDALKIAESIKKPYWKGISLSIIAVALSGSGQVERSHLVLEQAFRVAQNIKPLDTRVNALWGIARALDRVGQLQRSQAVTDQAIALTQAIRVPYWRLKTLTNVASALAQAGQLEQAQTMLEDALRVAQSVEIEMWNAHALSSLITTLAEVDLVELMDRLLELVDVEWWKEDALKATAAALVRNGQIERALDLTRNAKSEHDRSPAQGAIVGALIRIKQIPEALQVAQMIERVPDKVEALSAIVSAYTQDGQMEQAITVARDALNMAAMIEDADWKEFAFMRIASALARAGQLEWSKNVFEEALRIAHSLEDRSRKASALGHIASELAVAGQPHQTVLEEALQIAQAIGDLDRKAMALGTIAYWLANSGQVEDATRVAQLIESPSEKVPTLRAISTALRHAKQIEQSHRILDEALQIAQDIQNPARKSAALLAVSHGLARSGRINLALSCLSIPVMGEYLDVYLGAVFSLRDGMVEHMEDGDKVWRQLCVAVLDIVMWIRPFWREVRDILAA